MYFFFIRTPKINITKLKRKKAFSEKSFPHLPVNKTEDDEEKKINCVSNHFNHSARKMNEISFGLILCIHHKCI